MMCFINNDMLIAWKDSNFFNRFLIFTVDEISKKQVMVYNEDLCIGSMAAGLKKMTLLEMGTGIPVASIAFRCNFFPSRRCG